MMIFFFLVFQSLYLGPVQKYITADLKPQFMAPFLHGEKIGCFALSEPGNVSPFILHVSTMIAEMY